MSDDKTDKAFRADPESPTEVAPSAAQVVDGDTPTEVVAPPTAATGANSATADSGATRTRGFTEAQQLARDAGSITGRLLKERFVLEDIMGEGGMGRVYRARDLRKVEAEDKNPYVAVKVLSQNFKDHPQAFVALQQESVKSQRLAHPNIVTVYDFDRDGDNIFMTMELLKGDPLDQLLKLEGKFSKEVALRYFRDLSSGLEYAHKRGLVHSDFKPGNIFVTTAGVVKILDFGIARAVSGSALSHDYDAGSLGALTPAYATVEMVEGQPPAFSDDIYALACVTYQMLTGEHPYGRQSAAKARDEKLEPKKPEVLDKAEWLALRAALSVDKDKRPASIHDFSEALIPGSSNGRSGLWAGLAAAVLLIGGGLGYWLYQDSEAGNAAVVAERLQAARTCFIDEDFACAIENALVVRNLDPGNTDAELLLGNSRREQAEATATRELEALLTEARGCLDGGDFDCTTVALKTIANRYPDDPRAEALADRLAEAQQSTRVQTFIADARACLEAGDFGCAEVALADAEAAGALASQLKAPREALDAEQARLAALAEDRAQAVASLEAEARKCFAAGDFDCAAERADDLTEMAPDNLVAVEIRQGIAAGEQARAANERLVAGMVAEAEACFERKDFSCTIAKSEAALSILPDHAAARAVAEKARRAQDQAKKTISIE